MIFLMRVERWDPRREGPLSEGSLRRKVLPPGSTIILAGDREQISAVAAGLLRITLDGESAILGAGDSVHLSPGAAHQAEVLGSAPVVSLGGQRKA
jgi:mannose-6-phosphate isomerase-like protein (cupin superfamily)